MSDFNDKFKTMMTEAAKIGTLIKVGSKLTDPDGNQLKVKKIEIVLESIPQNRWVADITYDYKATDGTKGTESNKLDSFIQMVTGDKNGK